MTATTGIPSGARVDGSTFRRVLGYVPTSVVVAATMLDGAPVGMVIGTFGAVSSDPPLVGFFGDGRSRTVELLLAGDEIAFSLLEEAAEDVCAAFRLPLDERFATIDWHADARGLPVPDAAIMTIDARVVSTETVGDHRAVIAEPIELRVELPRARPLIYFNKRLGRLLPDPASHADLWQLGWDY